MEATLIVLAQLFATALMPTVYSDSCFAAKNTYCSNFAFLAATFVAADYGLPSEPVSRQVIIHTLGVSNAFISAWIVPSKTSFI
jgi:hypothetical protein